MVLFIQDRHRQPEVGIYTQTATEAVITITTTTNWTICIEIASTNWIGTLRGWGTPTWTKVATTGQKTTDLPPDTVLQEVDSIIVLEDPVSLLVVPVRGTRLGRSMMTGMQIGDFSLGQDEDLLVRGRGVVCDWSRKQTTKNSVDY